MKKLLKKLENLESRIYSEQNYIKWMKKKNMSKEIINCQIDYLNSLKDEKANILDLYLFKKKLLFTSIGFLLGILFIVIYVMINIIF